MSSSYPSTSSSNESSSSFQGIIDAFNALRIANGAGRNYYPASYQGIIKAIVELQDWGRADSGEYPPNWELVTDGSGDVIGGNYAPPPKNGDLWFDTRQGRLFIWLDDGYYQANGADGLPTVAETAPSMEVTGALWYNPNNGSLYLYDGDNWQIITTTAGVTTDTLHVSNTTTSQIATEGITVPQSPVQTQEDHNNWLVFAINALESEIQNVAEESVPLAMGVVPPSNPEDGDFFFNTSTNTLLVYRTNTWYPATPDPVLSQFSEIQSLQNADSAASVAITDLQNAVSTLQSQPHRTYNLSNATHTGGAKAVLTDSNNTTTYVGFTGVNGTVVTKENGDIQIDTSSLQSAVSAIQSDYVTSTQLAAVTATDNSQQTLIDALTASVSTNTADISTLNTSVSNLPTLSDVQARLPLAGGTLTGSINLSGNSIENVADPTNGTDVTTKQFEDAREVTMRNDLVAKSGTTLQSITMNNSDLSVASLDFSTQTVNGNNALKFKTLSTGASYYATFGTTDKPWEYSWEFDSDEAFNWIHDGERVFAIQGDNAYAKDLVLCTLSANSSGPLYNNQISVRTKLTDLETTTAGHTTQISQLVSDASTAKTIYYGNTAPTGTLANGDIWFDSGNIRLNVWHSSSWISPDRVEDVALKNALFNAVNTSTDYASLKTELLAVLT